MTPAAGFAKARWIVAIGAVAVAGWFLLQRDESAVIDPRAGSPDAGLPASSRTPSETRTAIGAATAPITAARFSDDDEAAISRNQGSARVWLTGRVVDASDRPVAGAPLRVLRSGTPALHDRADVRGRIKVDLGVWGDQGAMQGMIVAGNLEIGAAARRFFLTREDARSRDLGDLVLRPAGSVEVLVQDGGRPARGASVAIAAITYAGAVPEVFPCDDRGRATLAPIPEGGAMIMAWTAAGRVGKRECNVPLRTDPPLVIDLAEGRTLAVKVRTFEEHQPVPGARVDVIELERNVLGFVAGYHPTALHPNGVIAGADGVAAVAGISANVDLIASATAPGFVRPPSQFDGAEVPPGAAEVVVDLMPLAGARFRIGDVHDAPAAGTELAVVPDPLAPRATGVASKARVSEGFVVVDACPQDFRSALVQAPDGRVGRIARRSASQAEAPVVFRKPRFLEVEVRRANEGPAAGVRVEVCSYPIHGFGASAITNDVGVARIGPFWGGKAEVYADEGDGARHYSSANLDGGDARVTIDLIAPLHLTIRCTVDGKPALPPSPWLWVRGATDGPLELDPDRAELRCRIWPASPEAAISVDVRSNGTRTWSTKALPAPVDGRITLEAALVSGSLVTVTVISPSDGQSEIELMQWSAADRRFTPQRMEREGRMSGISQRGRFSIHFQVSDPGRTCARDRLSGLQSAEVPVGDDGRPVELFLDLSHAGWVTGRVETPAAADLAEARVSFSGKDVQQAGYMTGDRPDRIEGAHVNSDGSFKLRVPGDREIRLVPTHPALVPADADGEAIVTGPRDGIRLRLVPGGRVRFALDAARAAAVASQAGAIHSVRVFESDVGAKPASTHRIAIDAGIGTFTGAKPGVWALWIDVAPFQPKLLRGVKLDQADVDLWTVAFDEGSELRVRLKSGSRAPRGVKIVAWARDGPRYSRTAHAGPGDDCVVRGLGPGRFSVRFTVDGNADSDPREFEVVADGRSPVQLDYDQP